MRGDAGFPVRLRYTKQGKVRWIGHRDLARAFERAFRIEALPLAFSEGFSPHPKISFGLALSVGFESQAEYLDLQLTRFVDVDELVPRLSAVLPDGVDVVGSAALVDRAPSLQEAVTAVTWRCAVGPADRSPSATDELREALGATIDATLAAPTLVVTRRRKGREVNDDIRPAIVSMRAVDDGEIEVECATRPVSPKPTEVLAAMGQLAPTAPLAVQRVRRTHQWIERDGVRHEPLDADRRPHVPEARAS
jgi:radical SAM-linked protein